MFRCALLLSLMTLRSVVGQPGVLPTRLGWTNGSFGPVISTARQRCVEAIGFRCQCTGPAVIGPTSAALKVTVGSGSTNETSGSAEPASTYALPVPELRDEEVRRHVLGSGRRGRLPADAREGPVVAEVADAVAGVLVLRLVVGEAAGQRAAAVPDVARDVEGRVRRRLRAVVAAGRAVGPVADVEVVLVGDRRDLDEERVDRDGDGVAREVGERVGREVRVALVRDAAREVRVVRRVVGREDPVEVLADGDQPGVVADRVRGGVGAVGVRDVRERDVRRRAEARVPALEAGVPAVAAAGVVQLLVQEADRCRAG